jgi:predicted RND superfamily exporter protein
MLVELKEKNVLVRKLPLKIQNVIKWLFNDPPKTARVSYAAKKRVGGSWHDYNVPTATLLKMSGAVVWERHGCTYESMINADPETREFMDGMEKEIQRDEALILTQSYPKIVEVIYNPIASTKEYVNISPEAAKLLYDIKGAGTSKVYRERVIAGAAESAFDELEDKGFVSTRRTLTPKGKELARNINIAEVEFHLKNK